MNRIPTEYLNDLAGIFDNVFEVVSRDRDGNVTRRQVGKSFGNAIREEAARREAEAKSAPDPVVPPPAPPGDPLARIRDKHAPAADDLLAMLEGLAMGLEQQEEKSAALRVRQSADRIEAETARADRAEGQNRDLMAENARLREALALILPLAKGYAHANDHQINRECIATASAALARGGDNG